MTGEDVAIEIVEIQMTVRPEPVEGSPRSGWHS